MTFSLLMTFQSPRLCSRANFTYVKLCTIDLNNRKCNFLLFKKIIDNFLSTIFYKSSSLISGIISIPGSS